MTLRPRDPKSRASANSATPAAKNECNRHGLPMVGVWERLMAFRDTLGSTVGPIFLRVALGVTFVWLGLGKMLATEPVTPEQAAILANMTVNVPGGATEPAKVPASDSKPDTKTDSKTDTKTESKTPPPAMALAGKPSAASFSGTDFQGGTRVARMYTEISLAIDQAAKPATDAKGGTSSPIWPAALAQGAWPKYLAWTVTGCDIVLGGFVLVGLLTRLSSLVLAGHMMGAVWLVVVGPAIRSGTALLGFLPNNEAFDVQAWMRPMWILLLLCSSLALVCVGSGGLSLDRGMSSKGGGSKKPAAKPSA